MGCAISGTGGSSNCQGVVPQHRDGRPPLRCGLLNPNYCYSPSAGRARSSRRRGLLPSGVPSPALLSPRAPRITSPRPQLRIYGPAGVESPTDRSVVTESKATRKRATTRQRLQKEQEAASKLALQPLRRLSSSSRIGGGPMSTSARRRQSRHRGSAAPTPVAEGAVLPAARADAVRRVWDRLQSAATNEQLGKVFYQVLFKANPGLEAAFRRGAAMRQGQQLFKALGNAVRVADQPDALKEVLASAGAAHRKAAIQVAHFPAVGKAIEEVIAQKIGNAFDPDRAAWCAFFGAVREILTELSAAEAAEGTVEQSEDVCDQEEAMAHRVKESWESLDEKVRCKVMETTVEVLWAKDDEIKKMFKVSAKAQAKKMVTVLSKLVGMLPDMAAMMGDLQTLGARHVDYGVEPWHFELIGECLLEGLGAVLRPFNPKVRAAWHDFYERITFYIVMSLKTELEPATTEHVRAVQQSWETLRGQYGGHHGPFGEKLVPAVRKSAVSIDALFNEHLKGADGEKRLAAALTKTFDTIFTGLDDWDQLVPMLEELAKKHVVDIGVQVAYYASFGRAMLHTLQKELGSHWTETLRVAWSKVYRKVSAAMIKHQKVVQKARDKDADKKDAEWMYDLEERGGMKGDGGKHTWREVAKHNKKDDCWIVVRNRVYDVTKWLAEHPGGEAPILRNAGKDATEEFDKAHTGPLARGQLGDWYIAEVATKQKK
eukprot:TRINITY_DN4130_c1_g1_i1.p1 TRINITY_DN4130_c1_g1~~TRINITY_DN4130_c1_g1_i1.p1  ORF type:complete len:762 (+),score=213.50 TRINITY_DN4130_c1_g1_i1:142-2286(+)